MAAKGLVGMGRVVLSNRERPILIEPMGTGLRGITLRYQHEVRSETEYFADIPPMALPEEMLNITEHILETKKEDFDPAYLEDRCSWKNFARSRRRCQPEAFRPRLCHRTSSA
jgi:DNA end-binding protein Ku